MSNKIRTVFYAEEGAKSYVDGMLRHENFKSESDAISYLIALGMQAHTQKRRTIALAATLPDEDYDGVCS